MFDECLALWKQNTSSEVHEEQTDGSVLLGPEDVSFLFDKLLQLNEDSRRRRGSQGKGAALAVENRLPPGTAAGIIQLCKWEYLPASQSSPAGVRSADAQGGIWFELMALSNAIFNCFTRFKRHRCLLSC